MRAARCSTICGVAGLRMASSVVDEMKDQMLKRNKEDAPKIADLKKKHGHEKLSDATIEAAYGGMRGITGLVYESSLLDAMDGIRFRGRTIPECQKVLPKAPGGSEPLPEAMFWLLMTGEVPTAEQAKALNTELHRRADAEAIGAAQRAIAALPKNAHPMTAFSVGVMALQTYSKFAEAYATGKSNKKTYWEYALDDALDLVARTPSVAAMIYNRATTGATEVAAASNSDLDWAANFSNMLGFKDQEFWDCMRLYLSIHVDHEGGNVSAHTTTLVASALSDPYLAFSAGLNGLAGPLHGLANQEVLKYLFSMQDRVKADGVNVSDEAALEKALTKYTWELLKAGHVVPGYGHAVLRKTDPRYMCQRDFCLRHHFEDDLFKLVNTIYKIMPDILTEHGKTKNPYPNVDAHSGVLLQHYGLKEQDYYTVLFGLSRQMGVMSGVVWDRIQGRPLERPKSTTTEALAKKYLNTSL
ncbi:putative mitochondrial citrate synthase [Leptomonas pyrrhocoris]|uniref:Citrate synthase n=2 Tax=Leptomonas pyrrhocoris TaxID=157538 RepID=A0A0M9FY72_LEPPY|nr:putative mitochondrial citrate synthase [Leptomonas pyrrhocoris]XP_015656989.1 putative mitochondrial citrate synthase [Leptomonas pyrrhocoris]KPA78549.1 putative mitochondrial citrate synthase [Leptomonas pyrrhocoris]KPA78550.1 putative mitochondrial citrate synthase [Leptomonas pyrrhocoris]|eukprot:XP_015656988.1 putative mitochondrial citrate synthase [Leptomonas pyrrhocoris]